METPLLSELVTALEEARWQATNPNKCKGRSIREANDFCGDPIARNSAYCIGCLCSVPRCKSRWGTLWPLLGDVRLCSYHKGKPPPQYVALVEASNQPSDAELDAERSEYGLSE